MGLGYYCQELPSQTAHLCLHKLTHKQLETLGHDTRLWVTNRMP